MKDQSTLAIIDGDVLAYQACRSRFDGKSKEELVEFTPEEDDKYLEECWERLKKNVQDYKELIYTNDHKMAVKSATNFRDDIYPEYKQHRRNPSSINPFVPILRRWLVDAGLAVEAIGMEADDYIRIWSEECKAVGRPFVIFSVDKDLKCIPGTHYNTKDRAFFESTPEFAARFFYEQLLKGDPTDNIKGVPKIGPVKATNLLADCEDETEMQMVIVDQYYQYFGDQWKKELILNGRLLYLLKHSTDIFSIDDWIIPDEAYEALSEYESSNDCDDLLTKNYDKIEEEVSLSFPSYPVMPKADSEFDAGSSEVVATASEQSAAIAPVIPKTPVATSKEKITSKVPSFKIPTNTSLPIMKRKI
jgi:5'-3' exonuclease